MAPVTTHDPVAASTESLLTRRAFLGLAGGAAAGLALYAGETGRHQLVIERRTIKIRGLAEAFRGLRIVQISDVHFAEYTEPFFVEHTVREVNRLKPDIVLITGDFICMGPIGKSSAEKYAPIVAQMLGGIECPHRYGVLGNHDWMVNGDLVVESLKSVGIPLFHNANVPFERDSARFWIAGIMDALSWESDVEKSLPTHAQKDKEPVLLMAHEPDILPAVARLNAVDLMLSGHTHGGQVRFPFLPPLLLPPLGKRFVEGHFTMGRTQLYVNRGIGSVGLPFRFRCPSEITELTLEPT
jgi:predicted MPP superfamily phosphohydrolase